MSNFGDPPVGWLVPWSDFENIVQIHGPKLSQLVVQSGFLFYEPSNTRDPVFSGSSSPATTYHQVNIGWIFIRLSLFHLLSVSFLDSSCLTTFESDLLVFFCMALTMFSNKSILIRMSSQLWELLVWTCESVAIAMFLGWRCSLEIFSHKIWL